MATYQATFTADPRSVSLARTAIARFARLCGFDEARVADISLAAGEALTAAAEHSRNRRGGGFSVHCTCDRDELRIDVQESAAGEGRTAPVSIYGTVIMRSLMNEVAYSRGGTRIRLVKRVEA